MSRVGYQQRDYIGDLAECSAFPGGAELDDDFLALFQEVEDVVEGMVPRIFISGQRENCWVDQFQTKCRISRSPQCDRRYSATKRRWQW